MRSDSDDEDMSDFTGAGFYESYPTKKQAQIFVRYDRDKLFRDKEFQSFLFDSLIHMAEEIEDIMGCPQDIEGMYAYHSFYMVQTRS